MSQSDNTISRFEVCTARAAGGMPFIGPPLRPGTLGVVGRYELIRKIGEGGMGIVFLAKPLKAAVNQLPAKSPPTSLPALAGSIAPASLFAVKVLKPELCRDPRAVEHFRKEALHMRKLEHPSILALIQLPEGQPAHCMVMPYMERGSLDKRLAAGPVDTADIRRIAAQIGSALAHAHSRGIIHRDLKPRNILLDAVQNAFLTDFGMARSLDNDALTEPDKLRVEGTLPYLSPNAARGEWEDTRGDIYAFGAVLYEMLTGKPPYVATSREELLAAIERDPPPPIAKLNPFAAPGLVSVAERAMKHQLHKRYASMTYVLADLAHENRALANAKARSPGIKLHFLSANGVRSAVVLTLRRLLSSRRIV